MRWTKLRQIGVGSASLLLIAMTGLWTFWGTAEMYHEGWFGAWTNRLPYLLPIAVTLVPTVLCFRWPILGGGLLIGLGIAALRFFRNPAVAVMAGLIALLGALFVAEGWARRRSDRETGCPSPAEVPHRPWWRRDWRTAAVIGLSAALFLGVSAYNLPIVLTRQDDGDRSARLIEGNGVSLVWAPAGPGWNWKQPWGGYPSWQAIALYGVAPLGLAEKPGYGRQGGSSSRFKYARAADMARTNLCRFLSADGLRLESEPVDVWRMPTADELVRSLVRHGQNAGCAWNGQIGQAADCRTKPDKESPLWATDQAPIYYWAADEAGEAEGVFVAYNGFVNATRKEGGNPRHGYRCVREP